MPSNINVRSRYRSSGDVQQRHSDTYVGIKDLETGEIEPGYCAGTENSYPDHSALVVRLQGGRVSGYPLVSEELVCDRPELGMANVIINRVKHAVMFYGLAARQYKRSLSWSHLEYEAVDPSVSVDSLREDDRLKVLTQFYNDAYPTLQETLIAMTSERSTHSMAFSRRFSLLKTPRGIVLYYERTAVGYVNEDQDVVLFNHFQHLTEQLEEDK